MKRLLIAGLFLSAPWIAQAGSNTVPHTINRALLASAAPAAAADTTPPSAVTNLSSLANGTTYQLNLSWTSQGDDGTTGALTGTYRIFYSSVAGDMTGLTATASTTATLLKVDLSTTAISPGSTQTNQLTGLSAGVTYYAAIFTSDEVPNWSAISNGATAYTASLGTSDITVYWNADSIVDAQALTKGTGTVGIGASIISTTAIVGTSAVNNGNAGNSAGRITFSTTSLNFSAGRIGMYVIQRDPATSSADGDPMWLSGSTGTVSSKFHWQVNASGAHLFDYSNATQLSLGTGFLTQNTTAFVEFAFDYATTTLGAPCKVYRDGVLVGTCAGTPSAGAPVAAGTLRFGGQDANATSMTYDNFIFSTNPLRDLYALRNNTSF